MSLYRKDTTRSGRGRKATPADLAAAARFNLDQRLVRECCGISRTEWRLASPQQRKSWRARLWGNAPPPPPPPPVIDPILDRIRAENREVLSGLNNRQAGTKEGFLYVLSNPAWPGVVKVGRALDPADRQRSYNTGDPYRAFVLHGYHYSPNRYAAEQVAHGMLRAHYRHIGGEWFVATPAEALRIVRGACAV